MRNLIDEEKIEETLSGKTLEEIEELLEKEGIKTDVYGCMYEVNSELRKEFPNSYFLCEIYDESIFGINALTGSIIYELQHLGYLHTVHVEGHYGSLKDRLECGGILSCKINHLKQDVLEGKVPPIVVLIDKDLEHWDHVQMFICNPPEKD